MARGHHCDLQGWTGRRSEDRAHRWVVGQRGTALRNPSDRCPGRPPAFGGNPEPGSCVVMLMNGARRVVALVMLCAAMAACGRGAVGVETPTTRPASGGPVVPWSDAGASSKARPFTYPGITACQASDLGVKVHVANPSYVGGGPLNTTSWEIDVKDVGSRPCFVGPTPDVAFYTVSGPLAIPKGPPYNGDIVYLAPSVAPAPPLFGEASGEIDIRPCLLRSVDHMRIDFGNTLGTVVVSPGPPSGWGTPCPVASENYSTELVGISNDGTVGGYAPLTQTILNAPSSAQPGQHLHFLVTVENIPVPHSEVAFARPTPSPTMTFKPCPTFHDELEGITGTFHSYRLNCGAAAPIPFGGRETFAMDIDIPAAAQPGPAVLIWSIDGSPATYQTGHSYLQIS